MTEYVGGDVRECEIGETCSNFNQISYIYKYSWDPSLLPLGQPRFYSLSWQSFYRLCIDENIHLSVICATRTDVSAYKNAKWLKYFSRISCAFFCRRRKCFSSRHNVEILVKFTIINPILFHFLLKRFNVGHWGSPQTPFIYYLWTFIHFSRA